MEANQEKKDEGSPPEIPVNPPEKQPETIEQILPNDPVQNVADELPNEEQTNE